MSEAMATSVDRPFSRSSAAVHHVHLGAQPLGAAGGVHGHVAAADHGHGLALQVHDGRVAVLAVGLHQVDTGQELVGGIDALQVLAGDIHEHGQARAGTDEHRLKAVLLHQLVDGDGAAHHGVRLHLDAHGLQSVHFLLDDGSYGRKGLVTEALKELLDEGNVYDEIFAIGPMVMMKFVCKTTAPYNMPTTVSMSPIMIDGTGMCGGCRLTVGGETKFACVDGPDFDGQKVDWDLAVKRNQMYHDFEVRKHEEVCNLFKQEVK